jgi:hypothetical protein
VTFKLPALPACIAIVFCVTSGCESPVQPDGGGSRLLLATFSSDSSLTVLDVTSGAVVARPPSGLGIFGQETRAYDSTTQTLVSAGGGRLVGFDCSTMSLAWRETLGLTGEQRFSGQRLYPTFAMALAERTQRLFLADGQRNDTVGVSVLDATTQNAVGFVPRLRAAFLQPVRTLTDEFILVVGTTAVAQSTFQLDRAQGWFFIIDPVTVQVTDSLAFLPAVDSLAGGIASIVVDGTGRWVYFSTFANNIYRFDLQTRQLVASQHVDTYGTWAIAPDGKSLVLADGASSRDSPGFGLLYVLDAVTLAATPINIASAYVKGVAPAMHGVSLARDGTIAFVGAGTASLGPLFGPQRGRVLVVDVPNKQLKRVIDVDSWGVRSIQPLR